MSELTGPLKWHGGKHYLAARIVALMPPREQKNDAPGWCHYVEPYFGGGAVLLAQDPEGISEVVNDVNSGLLNFWRVLRSPEHFPAFARMVDATPFSERTWIESGAMIDFPPACPVLWAWAFFVRVRQSLAGRQQGFAPLSRTRTRRAMNEQAAAWIGAVEGLGAVHERLKRVVILGPKDAVEVVHQQDGEKTLFYLDPPYLHATRATTREYGEHEMDAEAHETLLQVLSMVKGRFLLSGYRSDLYDGFAERHGWRRADFDLPNNAAAGDSKRRMVEAVWMNYPATEVTT